MTYAARGIATSAVEVTNISQHGLWLLTDEGEFFLPFETFPWFKDAPVGKLLHVELPSRHHVYWPDLDVDLEIDSIVHPERYPLVSRVHDTHESYAGQEGGSMEKQSFSTFNNKRFLYTGSIASNLNVFTLNANGAETGTVVRIDSDTISYIKALIREKLDIKMGACRDNPRPDSLGSYLHKRNKSPQFLSYVLPLLEKEGYLAHYRTGRTICVKYIPQK